MRIPFGGEKRKGPPGGSGASGRRDAGAHAPGYTLIELMVVIFIITVVMAVVLPSFKTTGGRLRSDARKVVSILRYLNETATLKKQSLFLKFDLDEHTLTWPTAGGEKTETLPSFRALELQTKGLVEEGEVILFFHPMGLSEHIWIYLGGDNEKMTITMNPVSGRIEVIESDNGG